MNPIDIFCSLIFGGSFIFLAAFVLWALMVVAKSSDEISDKEWEEFCRNNEVEEGE